MKKYIILLPIMLIMSLMTSCFDYMDEMGLQTGLNDGLVAYWPMNENYPIPNSSLNELVKDYSGNNSDLQLANTTDGNGPSFSAYSVAGKYSNALQFDGGDYDYAHAYKTNLLRSSNEFSISLWTRVAIGSGSAPILTTQGFTLTSNDLADISLTINGSSSVKAESFPAWTTANQWTHIACTYDTKNISIFVNGFLLVKTPCSLLLIQSDKVVICTVLDPIDYEGCRTATLDEIRIYNRALSQEEIKALMDIGRD